MIINSKLICSIIIIHSIDIYITLYLKICISSENFSAKIRCYRFFNFFYIYGLYILFFVWTIGLSDYSYDPPKDAPNFNNQHLKDRERRFKLIKEISKSEEKKKIFVTIKEMKKVIQKLNSRKAADEYGVTAEHVKFAGSEIYTLYQDVFNQIFQEGKVAQSFKTGVITPILKKSKDQMLTENYRGITITSVHGKVFEYVLLEKNNNSQRRSIKHAIWFYRRALSKYGCTNTERSLFQHFSKRYTVYYNIR